MSKFKSLLLFCYFMLNGVMRVDGDYEAIRKIPGIKSIRYVKSRGFYRGYIPKRLTVYVDGADIEFVRMKNGMVQATSSSKAALEELVKQTGSKSKVYHVVSRSLYRIRLQMHTHFSYDVKVA